MKKSVCIVMALAFFFVSVSFAAAQDEREKLTNEIRRLESKLKSESNKSNRAKISKLIIKYKAQLAGLKKEESSGEGEKMVIVPKVGLVAGTAFAGINVQKAFGQYCLRGGTGFGFASNVSVFEISLGAAYPISAVNYAGLDLTYASYSAAATVPVVGNVNQGATVGAGIVYGHRVQDNIVAEIGYSTNMGILASAGYLYKF